MSYVVITCSLPTLQDEVMTTISNPAVFTTEMEAQEEVKRRYDSKTDPNVTHGIVSDDTSYSLKIGLHDLNQFRHAMKYAPEKTSTVEEGKRSRSRK